MIKNIWIYIVDHKWSKDILRANLLFIVLVLFYNLFRFHLEEISFWIFIKIFISMNACLLFNTVLNKFVR